MTQEMSFSDQKIDFFFFFDEFKKIDCIPRIRTPEIYTRMWTLEHVISPIFFCELELV